MNLIPMCNYDFDVVYQGLNQSIRHTEKCSYTQQDNKEALNELLEMAETVLNNLKRIELKEDEDV